LGKSAHLLHSNDIITFIYPTFPTLSMDSSRNVRAALATVLGAVAVAVGKSETKEKILPIVLRLLEDEFHDVRLNVVCHVGQICELLGGVDSLAEALLTSIESLISDSQWRFRLSIVKQLPHLAKIFGLDMFESRLESLFLSALIDNVHSVRECAIENIQVLSDNFGAAWTLEHMVPKILNLTDKNEGKAASYITRITVLHTLPKLASLMSPDQVEATLLRTILTSLKDDVPNVRFAAASTASLLVARGHLSAKSASFTLKPEIVALSNDSDVDVRYFAKQALASFV